jgi:hypothetical protein
VSRSTLCTAWVGWPFQQRSAWLPKRALVRIVKWRPSSTGLIERELPFTELRLDGVCGLSSHADHFDITPYWTTTFVHLPYPSTGHDECQIPSYVSD